MLDEMLDKKFMQSSKNQMKKIMQLATTSNTASQMSELQIKQMILEKNINKESSFI